MKKIFLLLLCIWMCVGCSRQSEGTYAQDQYYWYHSNMSASEDGYYICQYSTMGGMQYEDSFGNVTEGVNGFQVFFYDIQTGQMVAWCDRADCTHTNIFCDSFFRNEECLQQVYCYGNHVYMISMDEDYYYLEQYDTDGNNQLRQGALITRDALNSDWGFRFHEGRIYYVKGYDEKQLCSQALDKLGDELCYLETSDTVSMNGFSAIGENLYYFVKKEQEDGLYQCVFYRQNTDASATTELFSVSAELTSAAVTEAGDIYYYMPDQGLMRYDAEEKQIDVVYAQTGLLQRNVVYDGTNLYLDNAYAVVDAALAVMGEGVGLETIPEEDRETTFFILNMDGTLVDTVGMTAQYEENDEIKYRTYDCTEGIPIVFGGDERYLFTDIGGQLLIYDKSQLGGNGYWHLLDWSRDYFDFSIDGSHSVQKNPQQWIEATEEGKPEEPIAEEPVISEKNLMTEKEYEAYLTSGTEVGPNLSGNRIAYIGERLYSVANPETGREPESFQLFSYDFETEKKKEGKLYYFQDYAYGIWADGEELYMVRLEEESWYLVRVDQETWEETVVCELCTGSEGMPELPASMFPQMQPKEYITHSTYMGGVVSVYRGKAYVILDNWSTVKQISLADGTEKLLYQAEGDNWIYNWVGFSRAYVWKLPEVTFLGDWMYLTEVSDGVLGEYFDDSNLNAYRVHIETGEVEKIAGYDIVSEDGTVYYHEPEQGIMCQRADGSKPILIYESDCENRGRLHFDGTYLYFELDENGLRELLLVLDTDGQLIGTVELPVVSNGVFGGDAHGMVIQDIREKHYILDSKSLFVDGEVKWIPITGLTPIN